MVEHAIRPELLLLLSLLYPVQTMVEHANQAQRLGHVVEYRASPTSSRTSSRQWVGVDVEVKVEVEVEVEVIIE